MMQRNNLTLSQVVTALADGHRYEFWTDGLRGRFHKAPFPHLDVDVQRDGACSAITFRESSGMMISPVMLLDEFTDPVWHLKRLD